MVELHFLRSWPCHYSNLFSLSVNYFIYLKYGFFATCFFKFINYFYFKILIILFSYICRRVNYYLKNI
ncbi:hypothetical protein HMPREF0020_03678 [Acinetobacter baumannii 6013113]|nr:hypothetical protein HMPREF0020_03678 [Acinetobacter baumannii 6013113]